MKNGFLLLFVLILFGCGNDDENPPQTIADPNILLIIADDMGKDATAGFSEGSIKPNTPNLDRLKNEGLVFDNFWANPTCSSTRASIITGKYGYRTGVKWAGDVMDPSEKTLQKYISEETGNKYASAIVGKWHLSGNNLNTNPETFGLDYYAGTLRGAVTDYYDWQLSEDGVSETSTQYNSRIYADLSIDWINAQTQPWFLWLAFSAPHTPFHSPPPPMHSQGELDAYVEGADPMPYYMAAIEAMDFQIGRVLDGMSQEELDKTIILFLGDNGSPNEVAQFPYTSQSVKGSLNQGGVNVPMFVTGAGVGRTGFDDNLICSTDLFSTIADLAGVSDPDRHDSKSFEILLNSESELRDFQYSELDNGTRDLWAISNGKYKLIVNANGNEELYDLSSDPYENVDLTDGTLSTEAANAKAELEAELLVIRN